MLTTVAHQHTGPQSALLRMGEDLKAWMCLLPIAYQSDTNDYCSGEGLNVHHLKESSFIFLFWPLLLYIHSLQRYVYLVCISPRPGFHAVMCLWHQEILHIEVMEQWQYVMHMVLNTCQRENRMRYYGIDLLLGKNGVMPLLLRIRHS